MIKRSIRTETRGMIHLEDPRFQLSVDNNVESQDFKTHVPTKVLRLARFIDGF